MERKALIKYLCALLLFGLNGIVASRIAMSSYEIVFLRTLIGSVLFIALCLVNKGHFHLLRFKRDIFDKSEDSDLITERHVCRTARKEAKEIQKRKLNNC